MTDRELLELAAKAAGVRYDKTCTEKDYRFGLWLTIDSEPYDGQRRKWNPLTDDGDAFRLMVKLEMVVCVDSPGCTCVYYEDDELDERHKGDPYAATRRAITRAAAEIGRSTK